MGFTPKNGHQEKRDYNELGGRNECEAKEIQQAVQVGYRPDV